MNDIAGQIRGIDGCALPNPQDDYLAGWAVERYSKSKIVRAGKLIAGSHEWPTDELYQAFRDAHAWREAHILPMRGVRAELSKLSRKVQPYALTAARLKRMSSIRRKLKRNRTLYQIQDISGARVILNDMAAVDALTRRYVEDGASIHEVIDQDDDYIAAPKRDGYRSRHLVLKYNGTEEETAGNRLVVELQIRTRMQHAWATAVEAVGFVRNENLKAGEGSADWLRLFQLMSGEIAGMEQCPIPACCPDKEKERLQELRELDRKLGAVRSMESYNQALWHADGFVGVKGYSYLLRYDIPSGEVIVSEYSTYRRAARQYANAELFSGDNNAVLVEVDGLAELKAAYPNYFMDVSAFVKQLKVAVHGTAFVIPQRPHPIDPDRPRPSRYGDLSFLSRWKR